MDPAPEEVPAVEPTPEPVAVEAVPVEQVPDVDAAMVNTACFTLIRAMVPTNAAKMEVTLQGVAHEGQALGDYRITVERTDIIVEGATPAA